MSWAEDSRRDRETGAADDLAAGMSPYDVASRHALSLADVERIRDGLELPVKGLCRLPSCGEKAFRSGWCSGHFRSNYQGLHR